ncbi:MAG: heavy-metal-associated domain-containing protein [Nitrospirota bacterium]|nr:heavy-metal-associated domain-containing protein [Nitrospirota bacterium]MDE3119352.1 heavy-metal-associated domain-containing protein [Nitrospirota bacterium]MDE3226101.1 heavy-metal-associated domain-containing protein [Nitrospirota bacterium]MDE3241527.1 heavy-metal-associated domain-containing protein [Nitrospirota bacterium]
MPLPTHQRPRAGRSLLASLAGVLLLIGTVEAGSSRIALSVTGAGCDRQRSAMEAALKQLPGVRAVDSRTVPGHVLIDVEEGRVTAADLAAAVNEIAGQGNSCLAEAMQSCITAEPPQ